MIGSMCKKAGLVLAVAGACVLAGWNPPAVISEAQMWVAKS